MFSNTEKVRERKENAVCFLDSKYDWKEGSES